MDIQKIIWNKVNKDWVTRIDDWVIRLKWGWQSPENYTETLSLEIRSFHETKFTDLDYRFHINNKKWKDRSVENKIWNEEEVKQKAIDMLVNLHYIGDTVSKTYFTDYLNA